MDYAEENVTYGACQKYLAEKKEQKSTKAVDRVSMRGRRSDPSKWKIRTPDMTDAEYEVAIKKHRNLLSKLWRQSNPDYHLKYNRKNYSKPKKKAA